MLGSNNNLIVQSTDITLTLNNETNKAGTKAAPTVDGYTPIAIAGWYNINFTACAVQTLYLSGTTINLMAARLNNQSWSGSYTLRVFVLYQQK